MPLISFSESGNFDRTDRFLDFVKRHQMFAKLSAFGAQGVAALASATPKDSGATASAWSYEVKQEGGSWIIAWTNSVMIEGTPLVILLEFGHGTGTGGYVRGRNFIYPTVRPVFDEIKENVWKAVTSA